MSLVRFVGVTHPTGSERGLAGGGRVSAGGPFSRRGRRVRTGLGPLRSLDLWPAARVGNLGALVNRVYELGRYPRTLRHGRPLPDTSPLTPEDRAWAEAMSVGRDR